MKKETIFNLVHDWDGILEWHGVNSHEGRMTLKALIAFEVDLYRDRNIFQRILNKTPEFSECFAKKKK